MTTNNAPNPESSLPEPPVPPPVVTTGKNLLINATTMPRWSHDEAKAAIASRPPVVTTWNPSTSLSPALVDSNTDQGAASIAELARSLNNDPNLIYQFVHDNISYYPIYGVQKGAFGALLDGAGTDFDQAMLMVALLRQAGFTANYVLGQIQLNEAQTAAWLGCRTDGYQNANVASNLLANGGIPNSYTTNGDGSLNLLTLTHCWVQVNIGGTMYVYDPSMKSHTFTTGIDLGAATGYSRTALIAAVETGATIDPNNEFVQNFNQTALNTQLATYANNLVSYIKTNMPTATMDNIIGGSQILPATIPLSQTALSYEVSGDVPLIWTGDVPNSYKITVQVIYADINQTLTSDQICGRRFGLFVNGSGFAYLSLDGTVIQTATSSSFYLDIVAVHNAYPNNNNTEYYFGAYNVNSALICTAFGMAGRGASEYHRGLLKQNIAGGGAAGSEPLFGESLSVIWNQYYANFCKAVAVYDGVFSTARGISTVIHGSIGALYYYPPNTLQGPSFDLGGAFISEGYLNNATPWAQPHGAAIGMRALGLEALTFQQVLGVKGLCAATQVATANAAGYKIFWANGTLGNLADIETQLVGWSQADINQLVDNSLFSQQGGITIDNWIGDAWVLVPQGGAGGIISPGILGGLCTLPVLVDDLNKKTANGQPPRKFCKCPVSGDPISMSSGSFNRTISDLAVGSQSFPYGVEFERSYHSRDRFKNGPLGLGWTHNFASTVSVNSDGYKGLGEESPIEAAAAIVAAYAEIDLFGISTTQYDIITVATVNLIENWAIGQLSSNTVVMRIADEEYVFTKLADGSYNSPLLETGTLTLSGGLYTYKTAQQVAYNYDINGNLATIVYPFGVTVTLNYTAGNLTSVTNGLGRTLTLSYTGNFISGVSDGTGRSVGYVVDVNNNLTQFTDASSQITNYSYGTPGQLTQIFLPQNPVNASVTNVYDTLGRVQTQTVASGNTWNYFFAGSRSQETDPLGNTKVWYFDNFGRVTTFIDALGNTTISQYDGLRRLVQETKPEGNYTQWTYDSKNNILTETKVPKSGSGLSNIVSTWTYDATYNKKHTLLDPRSNTWTWNYDPATGNLLSFVKPIVGGQTPQESWTYNSRGQMLTLTDETSVVTQFNYDVATEKLTSVVADFGIAPHLNLTTSFGYDSVGNVTSRTDPNGNQIILAFDNDRMLTQKTDPAPFNYITKYGYDLNNNLTSIQRQVTSTPTFQTYTIAYTLSDEVFTVTDPALNVTTKTYDTLDRLWTVKDAENRVTTFSYDARSKLFTVLDATSTISETRLYTINGLLASIKDANNNLTQYTRDGFDRLDKTTYADSSFEENQVYDANGNVLTYRTRSGNTIVNTFDVLNRLSTKTPTGQAVVTFGYDLHNRLLSESTPVVGGNPASGNFQFSYDTAGRLKQETTPDSKNTQYQLDANGNLTVLTYPDGYFATKIYDQLNRLTDIKLNGAGSAAVHIAYDQLSRRSVLTYGNGASSTYTFQLNDDVTGLAEAFTGSSVTLTYGFNKVHQETSLSGTDGSYLWHPATASNVIYAAASSVNEYPTVGGVNYSYDGNANLTGDGVWTYTFDTENHLLTANKTGVSASYVYDPSHRQIQKTVGSTKTRYVYSGWQRIADYDGTANTLQNRYVYGVGLDEPLIQVSSAGVLTYLHADRLGSVIATTDSTGTVTNKSKYSPFGENAPVGTTFGFTGQRYDAETGLYYYKNRHYSPAIGRFLQTDPIGYGIKLDDCGCGCSCSSSTSTAQASVNLYGYVSNDPLNIIDPLGQIGEQVLEWAVTELGPTISQNGQNIANTLGIIGAGILGGILNSLVPLNPLKAHGTNNGDCRLNCALDAERLAQSKNLPPRDKDNCDTPEQADLRKKINQYVLDCEDKCDLLFPPNPGPKGGETKQAA